MTREILQLHFEKVIHVYTKMVITKMENGNSEILNVPRESRKIVKKILKKHQKEKNREVKTIHIQSDITKNSIIFFFFKSSFPKYPEMERPSENSSNFFLALFVPNWKEAMSTRNLESWTRC